jgi:hypothetical protein
MERTAGTSPVAPSISGEFMSDIQGTAAGAVDKFGNQIGEAVEKAGQLIDEKTGGKYSEQIQAGVGKVEDALDGLDGKNDDIGAEPEAPAEPTSEAPTEPQSEAPAEPTQPAEPAEPTGEAPAQPTGEAPAEPQSETPAPDPTGQAEVPAQQPDTDPGYAPAEPQTQPGYGSEPSAPEAGTTPEQ